MMAAMIKLQSYCRFGRNREFATKPPQMRKFVHIVGSLFAQVSYNHDSNSWLCYLSSVYDHFHVICYCYMVVMLLLCYFHAVAFCILLNQTKLEFAHDVLHLLHGIVKVLHGLIKVVTRIC